ncbi:MAG: 5-formyltetrahydrofolate cyclo-ligase [Bacillota bacterium]|nr:5-formyltetrahydrofolate cyclo-ligase [Bacillota bacterium]
MVENKIAVRKYIRDKRKTLPQAEKSQYDVLIYNEVINSDFYKNAKNIFIYVSYKDEVDTHKIIECMLNDGKIISVPKVISKELGMKAVRINGFQDLTEKGSFGILEPKAESEEISEDSIDLLLMPGLAFDLKGGRIGYGGGFYDRFLNYVREDAFRIALCYNLQIIDKVPLEPSDEPIDGLITETGVHNFR